MANLRLRRSKQVKVEREVLACDFFGTRANTVGRLWGPMAVAVAEVEERLGIEPTRPCPSAAKTVPGGAKKPTTAPAGGA
jgi:hypothetical protein